MSYNVGSMFICGITKPLYIYEGSSCSAALSHRSFFKSFKLYACSVSGAMPRIITRLLLIAWLCGRSDGWHLTETETSWRGAGHSKMTRLPDAGLGFLPLQLHPVPKSQGWPRVSAVGFCVLSVVGQWEWRWVFVCFIWLERPCWDIYIIRPFTIYYFVVFHISRVV